MNQSSPSSRPVSGRPAPLPGPDVGARSAERAGALDREWAQRRQETFAALEGTIQQAMGTVLLTTSQVLENATELHQEMEREARLILERLEDDRRRLAEEIADARRTRDRVLGEIEAITRRTEEEAGRIRDAAHAESSRITRAAHEDAGRVRRTAAEEAERLLRQSRDEAGALRLQAEQEHASVLRDAEERREQLLAEIRQMEQQFAVVTDRVGAILGRPGTARRGGSGPTEPTALRPSEGGEPARHERAAAEQPPAPAAPPTRVGETAVGPRATIREESAPPQRRHWAPSIAYRSEQLASVEHEPVRAWAAPEQAVETADSDQTAADEPNAVEGRPVEPTPIRDQPAAAASDGPSTERRPWPDEPVASAPAASPATTEPGHAEPAAPAASLAGVATLPGAVRDGRTAIRIAIANTPNLGRALEVQRSLQRTPGVRDVRAIQFEHGVLVLNVEHDDGLDLADAVGSLPSVSLESVGQHEDLLEFRFPAA